MSTQLSDVIQEIVDNLDRWKGLNEGQTTQVIILRLLQALGWNIWNPEEVVAQDTSAKGYRPDYILSVRRTPVLVLEVKGLDRTPNNEDRTQVVNYANAQNIRWTILTTGKQWEFFDNTLQAKAPEKRSLLFELDNPSAARYLERTLKRDLWEAKEASAKLARIVEEIRKEIETQQSLTRIEHKLRQALEEGYQHSEKGLRKAIEKELNANEQELAWAHFDRLLNRLLGGGTPTTASLPPLLHAFRQAVANRAKGPGDGGELPLRIWLNEEPIHTLASWRDFYGALVEALEKTGQNDILEDMRKQKDIVSSKLERRKRDGKPYEASAYKPLSQGQYLFVHLSAERIRKKIRDLLVLLNVPPGTFRVEYEGDFFTLP